MQEQTTGMLRGPILWQIRKAPEQVQEVLNLQWTSIFNGEWSRRDKAKPKQKEEFEENYKNRLR